MRPLGYRTFKFPAADTGGGHGLRISVFPRQIPLYWQMWLRCRRQDIRWAFTQAAGHDGRFPALALEHAAARRASREPDPEVPAVPVGPWWARVRFMGRTVFAAMIGAVFVVGVVTSLVVMLAAAGVLEVQVSTR